MAPILSRKVRHALALAWWLGLLYLLWVVLFDSLPFALEDWRTRLGLPVVLGAGLLFRQLSEISHPGLLGWLRAHSASYTKISPTVLSEQLTTQPAGTTARVALAGVLSAASEDLSPLSVKLKCAAWRVEVELLEEGDRLWSPLARGPIRDALVVKTSEAPLKVESLGVLVDVPPGTVFYGDTREEIHNWAGLDEYPKLKQIVDEALVARGLKRADFTGVRALETRLYGGAKVSACGEAQKVDGKITLAPGAILIATDAKPSPIALPPLLAGLVRRAGAIALFALAIGATLNTAKAGNIDYVPPAENPLVLEVDRGGTAPGVSLYTWQLTPDSAPSKKTLYIDETPTLVDGRMRIRLQRSFTEKTNTLEIGKDAHIAWNGDRWWIDLPMTAVGGDLPPSEEARTGLFSVRNRTPDVIGVVLRNPSGESLGTWVFDPGDGADEPFGNKLVDGDVGVEVKPGFTIDLTRERRELLCDRTLAECPLASFDGHRRRWLIHDR